MDAGGSETQAVVSTEDAASAFGAILDALSRVVSPALIDGAGWEHLRAAVGGLPVDPGSGFGFELRLGEPAAGTDFYIALPRGSALADHYIRRGGCAAPGSAAAALRGHLAAIDAGAPWAEVLGVEFDVSSGSPGAPPGLFARLRSDSAETGAAGFPSAETVAEWIAGAVGLRLAAGEREALERVFDELAAGGGAVDCVGIMPGRPERAFKVNSRSMEPAQVAPALEKLRWRGADRRGRGLLVLVREAVPLAPARGRRRRRGSFAARRPRTVPGGAGVVEPPGVGDWEPFLARLCEDGLCLPEKMAGLLAWPGREIVFGGRQTIGVLTGLAHFKVSFEKRGGGAAIEAKTYPTVGYLPFDAVAARFGSR